jgi:hypothetical protein
MRKNRRTTPHGHHATRQNIKKLLYVSGSCQKIFLRFSFSSFVVSTVNTTTYSLIINSKTVVIFISILNNTKNEVLCCCCSCHFWLCCCLLWIFVSCCEFLLWLFETMRLGSRDRILIIFGDVACHDDINNRWLSWRFFIQ